MLPDLPRPMLPSRLARVTPPPPPRIGRQGRHAGVAAHVSSPCALAGRAESNWRARLRAGGVGVAAASSSRSRSRRHQAPFINSTVPSPPSPNPRFRRIHQLLHAASARSPTPSLPVPATPPAAGAMGSAGREPEVTRADFPDGFVFGVATSAYQIEGARREGGKGDNIWDVFTDDKERVLDRSNAEIAVDHYHRYKEDIELMASLGFSAYRFSISWARIFPDGLGEKVNEQGVTFYNDLINFMISKGIEPYATLYHWDLPNNLQKTLGGWISDKIVDYFALYAEACFANFGDRVKRWITINEPLQTAINGYGIGIFAPGGCQGETARCYLAAHHQILAHAAAVDVYRRKFKAAQGGEVGFVVDCEWAEPFSENVEDQIAAQRRIDFQLGWFLDPIYFGDYPESMRQQLGSDLPTFSEKDKEFIRNKIDFIGVNHYTSRFIAHHQNPDDVYFYKVQQMERIEKWNSGEKIGERAASEWLFIVPWGLHKLLNYIVKKYNNPVIYVTENGMDEEDDQSATLDQVLNDTTRVGYFKGYLKSVARAIKDGADVRGYFAWSFLDNFEWAMGYTKRFGIVYVDYKNGLSRHPKASALWFSRFLKGEAAENKSDTN